MFGITSRLDAPLDPDDILAMLGLDDGGRVQQIIDQRVIDYCQPYTPASPDRTLEFSAQASTEIGSGLVIWNTPYARYQFRGIVYGPNFPIIKDGMLMGFFSPPKKYPTDRELTYDTSQNPMAGPRWIDRMKADRMGDLLDEIQNTVKGG